MSRSAVVLIDDRVLVEELLVGLRWGRSRPIVYTTQYWYYRACRAAVAGAGGHLSGPFEQLAAAEQQRAILSLLELSENIELPDPRVTAPLMAEVARLHPTLNLLNVAATAAAMVLDAEVWLSAPAANGILPSVLEAQRARWRTAQLG